MAAKAEQVAPVEPTPPQEPVKQSAKAEIVPVFLDRGGGQPDFIYGGPFYEVEKPSMFINATAPINVQLQGTFKQSYAYRSLKDRMPVILTKVIDHCSKDKGVISKNCGASADDLSKYVNYVAELKNELVTNKNYKKFAENSEEAKKWNEWLNYCHHPNYYGNDWAFTECYIYRRLREGCVMLKSLDKFDPFQVQKEESFQNNLQPMCMIAERLVDMATKSEDRPKKKEDFQTLMRINLWANKCDMSLSGGSQVTMASVSEPPPMGSPASEIDLWANKICRQLSLCEPVTLPTLPPSAPNFPPKGKPKKPKPPPPTPPDPGYVDPFNLIAGFKLYLIADDSGKIFEFVDKKGEKMKIKIENKKLKPFKEKCSCHKLAKLAGMKVLDEGQPPPPPKQKKKKNEPPPPPPDPNEPPVEEPPKIPCPAKITVPSCVMFDIVCDNSGYELFTDMCVAHFIIQQEMVDKVRFHLKKYPWFVSDATIKDFNYVISACKSANYNQTFQPPAPLPPANLGPDDPPPEAPPAFTVSSRELRELGTQFEQYVKDGIWLLMDDDFWTYPHTFKDMKKYDPHLYRKLQFPIMILYKGDLNYRKLVDDMRCLPTAKLDPCFKDYKPAPMAVSRTIKSETIAQLKKNIYERCLFSDPEWMEKGNFGVIQMSKKAEKFKKSTIPCVDYGGACMGLGCPVHDEL